MAGGGCGAADGGTGPDVLLGSDVRLGPALFHGDFDTGDLSQWPIVRRRGGGRLRLVRGPVHDGEFAARFEVRPGGGAGGSAAELAVGACGERRRCPSDLEGLERWYGWSSFVGRSDSGHDDGWLVLATWAGADALAPALALELRDRTVRLRGRLRRGQVTLWRAPLERERWQSFTVRIHLSSSRRRGFVELWRNGRPVLRREPAKTLWRSPAGRPDPLVFAVGLQTRSGLEAAQVIYHDSVRVGRRSVDVTP